eukprot:scaffold412356_cov31-Prasinocladus_malaysianus.AAC.1
MGTGKVGCAYEPALKDLPSCTHKPMEKRSFVSLNALDKQIDHDKALTVHFPVRALNALSSEVNLFGFDHIVSDNSFFKPMGGKTEIMELIKRCDQGEKSSDLLYIARLFPYKGQLKFIEQARPELLRGHTIHFYGSGGRSTPEGRAYVKEIEAAGERRGIRVKVHFLVTKQELLAHVCRAAGQILWPSMDSNPRAGAISAFWHA